MLEYEVENATVVDTASCQCPCCLDVKTPHQPRDVSQSKVNDSYKHTRMIQTSWYKLHPWITVCTSQYKIFCATCRSAQFQGLLTFPEHRKPAFVSSGFNKWKNALRKFREHENCSMHNQALLKLAAKASSVSVSAQLSSVHSSNQKFHRNMLQKVLLSVQYLSRQGLPLRGHREDAESLEGNLYQLLLLLSKECQDMKSWIMKKEYTSPVIITELINMMGQAVLRNILSNINDAKWFSIIADEASDISHNEQLSLSIRWVDSAYDIHEECIGLIQLPNTKAETIYCTIRDILIRCSLPITHCRGQAFDGASNMSGIRNGVQALVKKEASKALYVHCLAHSLNLCLKDVTNTCDLLRNIMSFIHDLVQLIKFSPKRLTIFDGLRKEVNVNQGDATSSLRNLCPTRWTVRHSSIESILTNYEILQTTLEEAQKGHDDYAAKASGLLIRMEKFETYFSLRLGYLIFSASEQLSINLQSKDITIQEAIKGAILLSSYLNSIRTDKKI